MVQSTFVGILTRVPVLRAIPVWGLLFMSLTASAEVVDVRPVLIEKGGSLGVEYRSGTELVGRSTEAAPAGVELLLPNARSAPVSFQTKAEREGVIELGPAKVGTLTLRWRITQKTPSLVERTLEVTAEAAQRFAVTFPLDVVLDGEFASFTGPDKARTLYDTVRGSAKTETFPVAMVRTSKSVFGVVADSPGLWENRCQVLLDPPGHRLAVLTGDGRAPYPLIIKPPEDARDTYQYQMDGWQSLAAGETRRFTTWVFASPARSHYDAQVAAHLAVANGKGWNSSVLEAILRNTSLFLLRRNLALDANNQPRDGRYIEVLTHVRTSERVKTPYGLRVISQADGSLLPGHSGVYCFGGSWFLNDAANYLLAGVHGLPTAEVDALLAERIAREIVHVPAFNESISTVTGQPHGHILYSWNPGYWWLRKEIRRRLGQTGPDPVGVAIDARLGVVREIGVLRLEADRVAQPAIPGSGQSPEKK